MTDHIFERLDEVLADIETDGWAARTIELSPGDAEAVRMQVLEETGVWIKPGGVGTYRKLPVAAAESSAVFAERDEETKRYPLSMRRRAVNARSSRGPGEDPAARR